MTGATIAGRAEARRISRPDKRVILLVLFAALLGVWCVSVLTREIYPAPIFPSFGTVPAEEGAQPVRVRVLAFESGEGRAILTPDDAFAGAFDSFHGRMLDSLVRADGADEDFARWARERAAAELGWPCTQALEVVEVFSDGSGQNTTLNRFEFSDCRSE